MSGGSPAKLVAAMLVVSMLLSGCWCFLLGYSLAQPINSL